MSVVDPDQAQRNAPNRATAEPAPKAAAARADQTTAEIADQAAAAIADQTTAETETSTTTPPGTQTETGRLPGVLTIGSARAGVELRTFFRRRETVVFTFALPVVIMLVLGSVFRDSVGGIVTASQHIAAGMLAGGIASTSFVNLSEGIATDRENGTLRRLRGLPMPPAAYFLGKIALVVMAGVAEAVLMLAIAALAFGLPLPDSAGRWFTFGWVFVLGAGACSLLGIALSSLARSPSAAAAMSNLALVVLQFVSGVYVLPLRNLPAPLIMVGSVFPLKWMAQGFRSVFLPDAMAGDEVAGTWEHGRTAAVLGAWCIGGLVLCLTTFRWRGQRER